MTLGERLRIAREHAKLTQPELAERSRVSQQMISKLERGLSKETAGIVALAVACGVRSEWLDKEAWPMVDEPEPDPEVLKLARAIQALSDNNRAHLQAVTDAFVKSAQLIDWVEGVNPGRRKGD